MKLNEIITLAKYAAERINSMGEGVTMSVHRLNFGTVQLRTFVVGMGETDRTNIRLLEYDRYIKYKILSCYQCAKNRLTIN